MSKRRNVRWGPCPFCGAEGWDAVGQRQSRLFDHDRPEGGRCRKAAEQYEAGKAAGLAAIKAKEEVSAMGVKRFTMRDENGRVVAGLEDVEEGNALLWHGIAWSKSLLTLNIGETAHGTGRGKERYDVTRTR